MLYNYKKTLKHRLKNGERRREMLLEAAMSKLYDLRKKNNTSLAKSFNRTYSGNNRQTELCDKFSYRDVFICTSGPDEERSLYQVVVNIVNTSFVYQM